MDMRNNKDVSWVFVSEIQVGNRKKFRTLRQKMPKPFANHGAFNNYTLVIYPVYSENDTPSQPEIRINLNYTNISPQAIEMILRTATHDSNVIMHIDED